MKDIDPKTSQVNSIEKSRTEHEQWLHMYRQMLKIRKFEENVNQLYTTAKMPGLSHLSIGQEAVAVGVCESLRSDDYITSTHRGHGHCLAKGAKTNLMFAELLGKASGYCSGKGGSMHIADQENGNLGANAIVAGSVGGDSFAGAMMGYLTSKNKTDLTAIKKSVIYGNVMGSFAVEGYGPEVLLRIKKSDIKKRMTQYEKMTHF